MFDNSRFALVITQAYAFVTRINITSTKAEGEAVRLSEARFERGFRLACEVKA